MTNDTFLLKGINIILNKELEPLQMKEKGYINSIGKEIVQEVEVGEIIYSKLKKIKWLKWIIK